MAARPRGFGAPVATADETADRASIRRANLGVILRRLRDHGPRSRTRLAEETGLPKATISSLMNELSDLGLVREGEVERDSVTVGRPRLSVELDGREICGIGVEINVDYVSSIALDLRGKQVFQRRVATDALKLGPEGTLDAVAALVQDALVDIRDSGVEPVGVMVAVPGHTDALAGISTISANLGWHDVAVTPGLRERLGPQAPPLSIGNDARLSTISEYMAVSSTGVRDMVYVTGDIGVGGGIVMGGREHQGFRGATCEFGHMPLDPDSVPCVCGRRGCWETMIGLGALLTLAADPDDVVRAPWTDRERRLAEIRRRAEAGDVRTLAALRQVAADLGRGVALLVDIVSPELVVLGGYFAYFGDYLLDQVQHTIDERVLHPATGGCRVALSTNRFTAAVRGGAQLALEGVFQDPARVAS
ncbi:ROK family protein [Streptomyces tubercidicus]